MHLGVLTYAALVIGLIVSRTVATPMDNTSMMSDSSTQASSAHRSHWPHLTGTNAEEAIATLTAERPELKIVKVSDKAFVTMDMHFGRVRVFVDSEGKGITDSCLCACITSNSILSCT